MKDHFAVGPRKAQRAGCKVTQREPSQVLTRVFFLLHNSLFLSHRHNVPGAHLKQEPSSADREVFRSFSHSTFVYIGRLLCLLHSTNKNQLVFTALKYIEIDLYRKDLKTNISRALPVLLGFELSGLIMRKSTEPPPHKLEHQFLPRSRCYYTLRPRFGRRR